MAEVTLSPDNPLLRPGTISLAPVRTKSDPLGLQVSTLIHRSAPVVSPGLGPSRGGSLDGRHPVLTWRPQHVAIAGQAGAVYLIQRSCGCRASEALSLASSDIVLPDTLIIKAAKGSRTRSIRLPEFNDQFISLVSSGIHPLFSISYSHLYRQYKSAGIIEYRGLNRHNRVTHSLRKNFIQSIQMVSKDVGTTADIVGHKSKRSTIIYLKKGPHNG